MLAKLPADRYSSPKELLADLRGLPIDTGDSSTDDAEFLSQEFASAIDDQRRAATTRLDELMKTEAMARVSAMRGRNWTAGAALAGLAAGFLLAWVARPEQVFSDTDGGAPVSVTKLQPSDQLRRAQLADTEQAWQAIIQRPDAKPEIVRDGKKGLALYYLRQKETEKAGKIFDALAEEGENDPPPRSLLWFATTGQAIVAAQRGREQAADVYLEQLWQSRSEMDASAKDLLQEYLLDFSPRWQTALRLDDRPGPPPPGPRPDGPPPNEPPPRDPPGPS
jgi:hypothetical protein